MSTAEGGLAHRYNLFPDLKKKIKLTFLKELYIEASNKCDINIDITSKSKVKNVICGSCPNFNHKGRYIDKHVYFYYIFPGKRF